MKLLGFILIIFVLFITYKTCYTPDLRMRKVLEPHGIFICTRQGSSPLRFDTEASTSFVYAKHGVWKLKFLDTYTNEIVEISANDDSPWVCRLEK